MFVQKSGFKLCEHLEVIKHQEAIKCVETLTARPESKTVLHVCQTHRLVLARIDDASAGQYRSLPVRIAGSAHQPPEAWDWVELTWRLMPVV